MWENLVPQREFVSSAATVRAASCRPDKRRWALSGNLRFTRAGVYAEYLVSGLPFVFLSEEWQNTVAAEHAELWRTCRRGLRSAD